MHIDDAVHSIIHHIVHNFLYTSHPSRIHLSRRPCREVPVEVINLNTHVRIPCHRNTDSIETCLLEHLDQSLRSNRLFPCRLIVRRIALRPFLYPHISRRTRIRIKRITQIPSYTHIINGRSSRLKFLSQHLHWRHQQHRCCKKPWFNHKKNKC